MKRLAIRKTAGLMALIMTISLLLPVIAYAAAEVIRGEYDPQTGKLNVVVKVPNEVYVDGQTVSVRVYTSTYLGAYELEYSDGYANDGDYYYVLERDVATLVGVTDSVYIDVYYPAGSSVALTTYQLKSVTSGGGGFPGGGIFIPPVTDEEVVEAEPDGTVDADALKEALKSGSATVEISGEEAKLPASALTEGGVVTVVSELGSYTLPLDELNLEALSAELGVELDDLVIVVTIAAVTGEAKADAEAQIEAAGAKAVSEIIDFRVEAVSGDTVVYEFKKFGQFVERSVKLNGEASNPVGVRITDDGLDPVPTKVGDGEASLFSTTNSLYAVIDVAPKSFSDLTNHWAAKDITTLANKLIVNGTGAGKFEPARNITRAEFAAMIVRALGLQATEAADFSDVPATAWYADEVAAAAEFGIVKGDGTGKFRPTDTITRQEMAVMVIRAQALAGEEVVLSNAEIAAVLGGFSDAGQIGSWARAELAAAIDAGIVKGTSNNTVSPTATATRAEAAAMIIRFLGNVDFI